MVLSALHQLRVKAELMLDLTHSNENETWAARCYGLMRLSDTQFKVLGDVIDTDDLRSRPGSRSKTASVSSDVFILDSTVPDPQDVARR